MQSRSQPPPQLTNEAPNGRRADPPFLSIKAASALCGVSRSTLFQLLRRGDIQGRKLGSRTIIPLDSVQRFLNALPPAAYRPGLAPAKTSLLAPASQIKRGDGS